MAAAASTYGQIYSKKRSNSTETMHFIIFIINFIIIICVLFFFSFVFVLICCCCSFRLFFCCCLSLWRKFGFHSAISSFRIDQFINDLSHVAFILHQ